MHLLKQLSQNKTDCLKLVILLLIYTLPLLSIISWGIPNPNHPFTYHMDEWHQFQAVKSVFKNFSNNLPGAAHGPMFQFLLTGIYLIPLYLLHIINPFVLKSSLDSLDMQEKIFLVLRFNTLIFGILSIVMLYILAKKYLRISPVITCILFLATPLWITLSNYYKYDIALTFWIISSLLALLNYRDKPTTKNFILGCAICALAVSTKISALPLIPAYFLAFFLFTPSGYVIASLAQRDVAIPSGSKPKQNKINPRPLHTNPQGIASSFFLAMTFITKTQKKRLILGTLAFLLTFSLFGIPDVLIGKAQYSEFLYSNLISGPSFGSNFFLKMPELAYLIFQQYPIIFGHGLMLLIIMNIFFSFLDVIASLAQRDAAIPPGSKPKQNKINPRPLHTNPQGIASSFFLAMTSNKTILFLTITFIFFIISLIPLKLSGTGNRSLVLLPFLAIFAAISIQNLMRKNKPYRIFLAIILVVSISIQLFESYAWLSIKQTPDPRITASTWIKNHMKKGSTIGIENIPIYQMIPDIILKDYYTQIFKPQSKTIYHYTIINAQSKKLPTYIVLTAGEYDKKYVIKSPKKDLVSRLQKEGYKKIKVLSPNLKLYHLFGNDLNYYIPDLIPSLPIEIYQSKKK